MPKYRVDLLWTDQFSGHFYIEADSEDEAWEKAKAIAASCDAGYESPLDFVEEDVSTAWVWTDIVDVGVSLVKE